MPKYIPYRCLLLRNQANLIAIIIGNIILIIMIILIKPDRNNEFKKFLIRRYFLCIIIKTDEISKQLCKYHVFSANIIIITSK